jgi:predicted transcriptional regulator
MPNIMPQEIEVWYLIPALRRELAGIFIKRHGMSQKKAANLLRITESAISQYLKSKRGNGLKFSRNDLAAIKRAANEILNGRDSMRIIYELCVKLRKSKVICEIHRSRNKGIEKSCNICFE